ncbi:hypothetical protein EVAR_51380_1 [Eumeta japonica]|uniref:Uncharacterized protein n=1 Tax=Eumeta variegata TaxID=151549 RepID=A0A4C1Y6S0_EUMVA|nr:hypothetical protein EVAR_51380_1 [Eumeta japonica]
MAKMVSGADNGYRATRTCDCRCPPAPITRNLRGAGATAGAHDRFRSLLEWAAINKLPRPMTVTGTFVVLSLSIFI